MPDGSDDTRQVVGRNRFIAPFLLRPADPVGGSLTSKRRNRAIAPYGPTTLRPIAVT